MGAFVLYKKTNNYIDKKALQETFQKKGFNAKPQIINFWDYSVWYYPKINYGLNNVIQIESSFLLGIGTFIYNKKWDTYALNDIYKSIQNGSFKVSDVKGDFLLLYGDKNGYIHFFPAPSYTYNIFYDRNELIFSSSFLATINGQNKNFTLNKIAITEIITTGNLIGPETVFKEIKRVEQNTIFKNTELTHQKQQPKAKKEYEAGKKQQSFSSAIQYQLGELTKYFDEIYPFLVEKGYGIGITGGLDSRLLLSKAISYKTNPMIYSTWRKNLNTEFSKAKKISRAIGKELNYLKHNTWNEYETVAYQNLLNNNFWYNDGLIRTHQLWIEEIKSHEYLQKLLGSNKINTSGVGGEQYRNNERLKEKNYSYSKWVKYELLLKYNNNPFYKRKDQLEVINYLKEKINFILNRDDQSNIHYLDIKRYYNEIYNPANRTIRNNIENQSHYFLSPFTDYELSQKAYASIPWLGLDFDFEKNMISEISETLAKIKTDYGFAPGANIPIKQRIYSYTKRNLPLYLIWLLHHKKRPKAVFIKDISEKYPFLNSYIEYVKELKLPINVNNLSENNFLSPLILELGYFINKLKHKIA